jgi:hypothetical protein
VSIDKDMEELGLQTCSEIVPVQINGVIYREPCTVPVLSGVDRCTKHGGAELVKQEKIALERTVLAQRKRLEEDVLPKATERILSILNDEEAKDADVINVWKAVMDRVGLAAVQGLVVEGSIHVEAPLDALRRILEGQSVVDGEIIE